MLKTEACPPDSPMTHSATGSELPLTNLCKRGPFPQRTFPLMTRPSLYVLLPNGSLHIVYIFLTGGKILPVLFTIVSACISQNSGQW